MKFLIGLFAIGMSTAAVLAEPQQARPWLGIGIRVLQSPNGQRFVYVARVAPKTPAAKANIQPGDIIVLFDRTKVELRDELDFLEFVSRLRVGQKVRLSLIRAGDQLNATLVVAQLPAEYEQAWREAFDRAKRNREAANE